MFKFEYFECDCGSPEHSIKFIYDTQDEIPDLYIVVNLINYRNFWKRLVLGIKYIFGITSKYGYFNEFILRQEDISKLNQLCQKFQKDLNSETNKN